MNEENVEYEGSPHIPFVSCQSQGGPWEDESFVAGYQMGKLCQMLSDTVAMTVQLTIMTGNRKQAEVIAKALGYHATITESDEYPEYLFATFDVRG